MTPPAGESTWPFSGQALPVGSGWPLGVNDTPQNGAASSVKFCVAGSLMGPDALVSCATEKSLQESVNVAVAMKGGVSKLRSVVGTE